jgi:hypothetical protein
MAIIVVGGSSQGAGKTSLVCGLIIALPEFRWTAIKITTHDHGQPRPIWEEAHPGQQTDTGRYLAAGAARAFLATPPIVPRSAEPDLPPMLDELWPHFGRGTNLIFESNSVVHHVRPNACLMIQAVDQRRLVLPERKPSFIAAIGHADAVVVLSNADAITPEGLRLPDQEPKPIFHLASLDRISPLMLAWLRPLLGASGADPSLHL